MIAAVQSFGIDAGRAASLRRLADSLKINGLDDTSALAGIAIDSLDTLPETRPDTTQNDSTFFLDIFSDSTTTDSVLTAQGL